MTAFALVTGTIFRAPVQKTAKSGKPYTICTVKVGADDGAGDFWNVLSFSESSQLELLRLEVGDAVSVRGKMKIETYVANDGQTKISRTIFADAALGLRPAPPRRRPRPRRRRRRKKPPPPLRTRISTTESHFEEHHHDLESRLL
jgi:Single-strand binding protein family